MQVPRMRLDAHMGIRNTLDDWTTAPLTASQRHGTNRDFLMACRDAGYEGVQGGDPALCRELGLIPSTGGRITDPADVDRQVLGWSEAGMEFAAIHLGTEIDDDATVDRLVESVLQASQCQKQPVYVETHRATCTQDGFRTLRIVEKFPEIRFCGDFSHWYTGHEMIYGNWNAKLDFYQPVFDRVRTFHGRIGNSSHMQVTLMDGHNDAAISDFKDIYRRCFDGYIRSGEYELPLSLAPELLGHNNAYARRFAYADGVYQEESDRWQEALYLGGLVHGWFNDFLTEKGGVIA